MQVARVRSMLWLMTLLATAVAVAVVLAAALWPLSLPTEASVIPAARVPSRFSDPSPQHVMPAVADGAAPRPATRTCGCVAP